MTSRRKFIYIVKGKIYSEGVRRDCDDIESRNFC